MEINKKSQVLSAALVNASKLGGLTADQLKELGQGLLGQIALGTFSAADKKTISGLADAVALAAQQLSASTQPSEPEGGATA